MKHWLVLGLAAIGIYSVYEWWRNNPNSLGGPNPNASEVGGVARSNFTSSTQVTSGIPAFNNTPIANGHGDQVVAAFHSNPYATLPGGPNYTPAFGPRTNRG